MRFAFCNGSRVIWGRLDDPSEGAMESEYFPSLLGEEESKAPKSTYILAFNLALTLELRGTEMLVKVLCGRESFKVVGAPPLFVPEAWPSWRISATSAVEAAPTELEDSKASGSNGIVGPVFF